MAAVEKRSGPPPDGDDGGAGGVASSQKATIEDEPEASGDPQVQVAMET